MERRILSALLTARDNTPTNRKHTEALLKWAYRFSPIIAWDRCVWNGLEQRNLNIDVSGCARLFKGEQYLLLQLLAGLTRLGFESRAAIAPSLGCAWAASRFGTKRRIIIQKQNVFSHLQALPIAALRIPEHLQKELSELNITRISHLLNTSRKALRARFDTALLERIDQALGAREEPLIPIPFTPLLKAKKTFLEPSTQIELVICEVEKLLTILTSQLVKKEQKAMHFVLLTKTIDAPQYCKSIILSAPSSSKKHIWNLLQPVLENLNMGHGVESLTLSIPQIKTGTWVQEGYEPEPTSSLLAELIDTLNKQLGKNCVEYVNLFASHIPEKSFFYTPTTKSSPHSIRNSVQTQMLAPSGRPSLLFYRPQAVEAISMLPDSPPSWVQWKGSKHRVRCGIGPERIAPEWWGQDASLCNTRDYFKAQIQDGTWIWIFRELETMRWYVHGLWA